MRVSHAELIVKKELVKEYVDALIEGEKTLPGFGRGNLGDRAYKALRKLGGNYCAISIINIAFDVGKADIDTIVEILKLLGIEVVKNEN